MADIPAAGKAEPAPKAAAGPYTQSLDQEKRGLLNKLYELQKSGQDAKARWWSWCKAHGEGQTDAKQHDVAFLTTFFESMEAGEIMIEDGCPFKGAGKGAPAPAGPAAPNGGKGGMDFAAKGGKDFGAKGGFGTDKGGFGMDKGGWGKDGGMSKGFGKDKGGCCGGKGGGDDAKVFVGGLPKDTTEQELVAQFGMYGPVSQCHMKYDEWGGFRGFAFLTFANAMTAQTVLANAANIVFKGKWIDCKTATGSGGGGGKGKDMGKGGFGGGKDFGKGGKDFGKGGKDFGKGKGFGKDKGKGFGKDKGWGGGW